MAEMATNGVDCAEPQPPGTAPVIEQPAAAPSEFSHFEAFDPDTCTWRNYAERLQNHFELYDVPDEKRVRVLVDRMGGATYAQLRQLCAPDNPLAKSADELFAALQAHFHPPTNKYKERVRFHRRVMRPDESMQEFAGELRRMAEACEFPAGWTAEALRTQFTHGVRSNELRGKLYQMEQVDFDQMLEFAASVQLPPPKKKNPAPPPNPPKAAKVPKKAPTPAPPPAPPAQPKKRPQAKPKRAANPVARGGANYRPQFRKNPPWQDDGYGQSYGGQYRNDYSSPRFVASTFKPNDSLFYRR